jgi:hypothetical protein
LWISLDAAPCFVLARHDIFVFVRLFEHKCRGAANMVTWNMCITYYKTEYSIPYFHFSQWGVSTHSTCCPSWSSPFRTPNPNDSKISAVLIAKLLCHYERWSNIPVIPAENTEFPVPNILCTNGHSFGFPNRLVSISLGLQIIEEPQDRIGPHYHSLFLFFLFVHMDRPKERPCYL